MIVQETIEKVLSKINRDEVTSLAMNLVNISSPTGEEGAVAEFILDWFKENGLETVRQELEVGRLNAVGILRGSGGGLNLMFNGHLDTSHPGTPEDLEALGAGIAAFRPKAFIEGDVIYGLGIYNDKGPIATAMIALKALKEARAELPGDVMVAAVSGEIGRAPVGRYQGPAYHGHGYGTRYLLMHGLMPDYGLVVEPSGYEIVWTLPGFLYIKVTTYGESIYDPFIDRAKWERKGTNTVKNTVKMLQAIENWAMEYEEKNKYESPGGTVAPKVNIGAIEAGRPFKPDWSPVSCSAYVSVRVSPNRRLMDVKFELEGVLRKASVPAKVEVYQSERGYEGSGNTLLVEAIRASYEQVFNTQPPKAQPPQASMWNDVNIFHEMGIPAVKFGPPCVSGAVLSQYPTESEGEGVKIDDFVNIAKIYALTALRVCTQDRDSKGASMAR